MILRIYKINKQTGFLERFPNSTLPAELYSFNYDCKRMGEAPTITGTIVYPLCLDTYWTEDVCVEFKGERYYIENMPSSSYSNQDARYKHEIEFVSERKYLQNVYFKDRLKTNSKIMTQFSFFGDLKSFVDRLNDSMSMKNDNMGYTVYIDDDIVTEEKNIEIDNLYILDALNLAFEEFGVPYYFVGKDIHFGDFQSEIETPLEYGADNALLSINRNNTNIRKANRITGVGSSDNIPYYYPNFNESGEHEITTTPSDLLDNIKSTNYLKIDPYVKLRDGGTATFYKATIGALGSDDLDDVIITIKSSSGALNQRKYYYEWEQYMTALGSDGHYSTNTTINIKVDIDVTNRNQKELRVYKKIIARATYSSIDVLFDANIKSVQGTGNLGSESFFDDFVDVDYKIDGDFIVINNSGFDRFTLMLSFNINLPINKAGAVLVYLKYDTKYYTEQRKLIVADFIKDTINETIYTNFEKQIEISENSTGYSQQLTYIVTREVAGYSDFSLDTAFKANFYGDTAAESFYPTNDRISVIDDKGQSYTPWISDTNYLYCRNNNPDRRVFTISMTARVDLLKPIEYDPSVINVNLVELSYIPDFYRNERNYDCFKVNPKSTSSQFIDYKVFGIKFYDKESVIDGSVITFSPTINWIDPKEYLMPYVYRETLGDESFYEAINNKWVNKDGSFITFPNPYDSNKKKELVAEQKEDIKPTIVGVKNASGYRIDMFADIAFDEQDNNTDWKDIDEDTQELEHSFFFVKLRKTDGDDGFNLFDQALEKGEMTITMNTGHCGSCNFTIMVDEETQANPVQVDDNGNLLRDENGNVVIKTGSPQEIQQDTSKAEVWIALKKSQDDYGIVLPDKVTGLVPTTEDKFVITNILLPAQYIITAEKKLEQELIKEMLENNDDKFEYSIDFSRIFLAENDDIYNNLNENSIVTIRYNDRNYRLYVSSYSYKMDSKSALPEIKVELSEKLSITKNGLQITEDRIIRRVEVFTAEKSKTIERGISSGSGSSSNIKVVQSMGDSKTDVMSQNAVAKAIEDSKINIVDYAGSDSTKVMSQKAVTDMFNNMQQGEDFLIWEEV